MLDAYVVTCRHRELPQVANMPALGDSQGMMAAAESLQTIRKMMNIKQ
jgi:hypothetical protein